MSDTTGSSQLPTRHRADDDMDALANGSFDPVTARTPNGDVDLLSSEAASVPVTLSSKKNDNNNTNIGDDNDHQGSIPATPFSIDDGIEDEEEFSTSDPSASAPAIRGQDPDGTGATTKQYTKKDSSDFASSFESAGAIGGDPNIKTKMGAKVTKLSHKTTKIISDYQAYLQEIETEFPSEEGDPALASVNDMRENVRNSFGGGLEEGGGSRLASVLEDGCITSGAVDNLAREWYRGREKKVLEPNIAVDRTGSCSDNLSAEEQLVRGQKYTHQWLHDRRIKRGIFAFVVLSVIIGVLIWSANNGNKNLPDWEGEIKDVEGEAKTSAGGPPLNQAPTLSDEDAKQQNQRLYETMAMRHRPLEFDRTRGWQGQTYAEALVFCGSKIKYTVCPYEALCPAGEDNEPLGGYREAPGGGMSWMPIMDAPNEWVEVGSADACIRYSHIHGTRPDWGFSGENNEGNTRNIMCCMGEVIEEGSFESAQMKYQPRSFDRSQGWVGKTYPEAVEFCDAIEEGPEESYELCSYDAVCPLGPDSEPLMGALGEDVTADAWLPVIDTMNEWIQVGQADSCIAYSHEHLNKPDWGMSGKGSEEFTRNVMCCLQQEENMGEGSAMLYQMAASKYHPHLYDRSHGWKGQTFEAALDFCDGIEGYELCPYDAVCPLGIDREPLSAYAEATGPAWIPIFDSANEWVNVGRDEACAKYSDMNSQSPEWGMNGIGNEEITRAIMCCAHPSMVIDPGARPHPNQITEIPKVSLQEVPVHLVEDVRLYEDAIAKYSPTWYNRDRGWTGQTYLQALQFCGDSGDGNNELCPLDAICPLGPYTEPLGGYREEPAGSWVPILDTANAWVQVSSTGDAKGAPCIRYDHENKDPTPQWGLTGEGDEGVTRHVFCCLMPPAEAANEITPISVMSPVEKITTPATAPAMADEMVQGIIAMEPEEVPTAAEEEKILIMVEKYLPVWAFRESGWDGRTYLEALDFCREKEGYGLCPTEAVCPLGPNSEPFGGYDFESWNESWVPIADAPNDWVQVGAVEEGGACIRYSSDYPKAPEWGLTGEDSEDITQRLACCMDVFTEFEDESAFVEAVATAAEPTEEEEVSNEKGVVMDEQLSVVYQTVGETYRPKLFDRNQGWKGQTYSEAFAFCVDFDFYMPCPYEAICPLGKGTVPLGGNKESNTKGGSWAPILEGHNEWVQLSEDGSCVQWSHLHPGPPPWGETGEDNEELTRNVACCFASSSTSEPTSKPTDAPTHNPTLLPTKDPTSQPTPPPTTSKPTNLPTETPTRKPTAKPTLDEEKFYKSIVQQLEPIWFSRTDGWQGQTYLEALQFCATKESRIPCPYIAYCPVARANQPLGGFKQGVSWAPIIDGPNAWVQVGEENTCELYSELYNIPPRWGLTGRNDEDLTRHVMCCLEEPLETEKAEEPPQAVAGEIMPFTTFEQAVLDIFKPQWYGRDDGYQGTTYYESQEFCNNVSGMLLCPIEAYCPNGPIHGDVLKPLFLQFEPFEGEQWAPVNLDDGDDDSYVLIGKINNNPATACHTFQHFNKGEIPPWGLDGSRPELKLNILCCQDPNYFSTGISNPAVDLTIGGPEMTDKVDDVETQIEKELTPEWLSSSDGWFGGSHNEAEEFCQSKGGKQICPYAAYCPHGPGQSVSKGHSTDISAEGSQWSPVFGQENHWVMVGQKHGNSATTCFGHEDLEGGSPDWGLTTEHPEIKKYLMCCHVN